MSGDWGDGLGDGHHSAMCGQRCPCQAPAGQEDWLELLRLVVALAEVPLADNGYQTESLNVWERRGSVIRAMLTHTVIDHHSPHTKGHLAAIADRMRSRLSEIPVSYPLFPASSPELAMWKFRQTAAQLRKVRAGL